MGRHQKRPPIAVPSSIAGWIKRMASEWRVRKLISLGLDCRKAATAPPEGLANLLNALDLDPLTSAKMRVRVSRAMRRTGAAISSVFGLLVVCLAGWLFWADRPPAVELQPLYSPNPNAFMSLERALSQLHRVPELEAMVSDPAVHERVDTTTPMTQLMQGLEVADRALPGGAPPSVADMQRVLDANSESLALIAGTRGVIYQRPQIMSYVARASYQPSLVWRLALLEQLQARVCIARGDWNGGMAASLEAVRIGRMVPHGGGAAGVLIGANCERIGRRIAWRCVEHLSANQAYAAARSLDQLRADRVPLATAIEEEMQEGLACMRTALATPNWRLHIRSLWIPAQQPESGADITMALLTFLDTKRGLLAGYEGWMRDQMALAGGPFQALSEDTVSGHGYRRKRIGFIGNMIQDTYLPIAQRDYLNEADDGLLQLALMVRWYRATHGKAPHSLAEIGAPALCNIRDPFQPDGASLRYMLVLGEPVIYSVGPDGVDDGGSPITSDQWSRYSDYTSDGGDLRAGMGPDGFASVSQGGEVAGQR